MSNIYERETPEETERRVAHCACLNADMIFRGVRDGLCYFDLYYESAGHNGPKVTLSLPTDGITPEKISKCAADWDQRRSQKKRGKK
jgi:hypothetical protein